MRNELNKVIALRTFVVLELVCKYGIFVYHPLTADFKEIRKTNNSIKWKHYENIEKLHCTNCQSKHKTVKRRQL